ncbi:MAG: helix-turn-helix domain-containing protein [Pseudomonadota bacterium]
MKRETKIEVLRMLNDGMDYAAICDALGISKGRVSQIKKQAIEESLIARDGKLTVTGFELVRSDAG